MLTIDEHVFPRRTPLIQSRLKYQRKNMRKIRIEDDIAYIPLSKGHEAIIDASDVDLVSTWHWQSILAKGGRVYAGRKVRTGDHRKWVWLHRVICPPFEGGVTDHIDGNTLNNRRSNLRPATARQNANNLFIHRQNGSTGIQARVHRDNRSRRCAVRLTIGWYGDDSTASEACQKFNKLVLPTIEKALHGV